MKILAIDTATEACSVALRLGNQHLSLIEVCPQQHAQKILLMTDQLLAEAGVSLQQLDGLAFGQGPGSFTGVRIATSIVQGFALATSLPVVGVSTLAAMAQAVMTHEVADEVAVAIDARMNEVYFARYKAHESMPVMVGEESVVAPSDVAQLLGGAPRFYAGTGWSAYDVLVRLVNHQAPREQYPSAEHMLMMAEQGLLAGKGKAASEIEPSYVRNTVTWQKLPGR
jgi:tRNA threonylcarbamoyladenosine biosynthesis protein TsaB